MRRSVLAVSALLLATLVPGGVAGAASSVETKSFCATFVELLDHLSGTEASVRTRAVRRRVVALMRIAPKGVTRPAQDLGHALLLLIDHGPKRVHPADKRRASKAGTALVAWGGRHCPVVQRKLAAARASARDRRVQSNLRNGLTNAKGIYTDTDSYTSVTPAALGEAEPSLHWVSGPADPADPTAVSVHVVDAARIVMAAGTGTTCYFIQDSAMTVGTEFAQAPGAACDAATPPSTFTTSWR